MPFQVNGQAVTTKSSRLLHVAGCDRAFVVAAGCAFVTRSSADAAGAYAAEASPRIIAMGIANLFVWFDPDRGKNNDSQCRGTEAVSEVSRPSLRTGPEQKPATAVRPAMRAIIMPPYRSTVLPSDPGFPSC